MAEEESPTQRIPRVQITTELPSAREMADPVAADPEVESPTQRIPRVKVPTQQLSINEMADQATAHHPALVAQKLDGEKALAEDQPNGARDYRTRVEGAELPDDVRKAALCEVGKLERTSDQSPESVDIRTWLDTILDLPWGTKTTDWIDIQGSREVEATLRRLIEPAAGDVEAGDSAEVEVVAGEVGDGDTAEVDPAIANIEKADRAPAGPDDDDTVETLAVLAGFSGRQHPPPQLPEQQVVGPVLVETPAEKRRFRSLALAAAALAALLIGALFFGASRDGSVTARSAPTVTATATATVSKATTEPSTIQLEDLAGSARPFEAVRIQGTYRGGAGTFVRVQRWEGGRWLDFPLPTKIDQSGQFITQAEFGQPGRYRLRVLDPDSGLTSKPFVVVIKG